MLVIANLPRYKCAKNYQNGTWFDKVIAKIKWCSFFDSHGSCRDSNIFHIAFCIAALNCLSVTDIIFMLGLLW